MARPGPEWMVELLCGPRVSAVAARIQILAQKILDARHPEALAACPQIQLEAVGANDRITLAESLHQTPVARTAICRQSSEVGAGWTSVQVWICAGVGRNTHPYRNLMVISYTSHKEEKDDQANQ